MAIDLQVNGALYPTDSTYPTHRATYGEGGYRVVDTITDRDAIPEDLITDGALVFVRIPNNVTYQWKAGTSTWDIYPPISSISTSQIANGAITSDKLSSAAVIVGKVASNTIDTINLVDGAITMDKLDTTVSTAFYLKGEVDIGFYPRDIADLNFMASFTEVPSSSSAPGLSGEVSLDADYLYLCVALDDWKRVAIATW